MLPKIHFILILFFLLLKLEGLAQSAGYLTNNLVSPKEVVAVDSITGIISKDMPFDENFYLKLFMKADEDIPDVKYYRVKGLERIIDGMPGNPVDSVFKIKNELYILVPPLKPGKSYDFLLTKNIYGQSLKQVVDINFIQLNKNLHRIPNATTAYTNLKGSLTTKLGPSSSSPPIMPTFHKFDSVFNISSRILYLKYYQHLGVVLPGDSSIDNNATEKSILTDKISLDSADKVSLTRLLDSVSRYTVKDFIKPDLKNITEETQSIINLLNLNNDNSRLVLLGKLPINYKRFQKATDSNDLEGRIKNLTLSKQQMEQLLDQIEYFNALSLSNEISTSKIDSLRSFFYASKEHLSTIIKSLKTYPKSQRILIHQWISASTITNSFSTKIEQVVVPDVGIVCFMPFQNNSGFKEIRPYYGVNIDLRPVNKNIRLRDLRKKDGRIVKRNVLTGWHYFSLMMGLTVGGSIEKEGDRTDLFGKTNLILGIGVRASNVVRFSTGALLFKKLNANPLITNKEITAIPFLSISFDIKVQTLVSSFTSVFIK